MKSKMKTLRILVAAGALAACVALARSGGAFDGAAAWGTLCALCPVGFAQVAAASGSAPWGLLPGVVALLVIVFVIGRAFCSWLCPSQLLKNIFGGHKPRGIRGRSGVKLARGMVAKTVGGIAVDESGAVLSAESEATCKAGIVDGKACKGAQPASATSVDAGELVDVRSKSAGCSACAAAESDGGLLSQGIVLAVLLAVSFVVRFPVFCLLCPIGLVFGTLWAINRVFVLLQPGWELIIFPLMLIVELFAFKRWCSSICPLGFFFGVVGKLRAKLGFGVRPSAGCATCISREGCRTCATVCPEDIDVARSGEADKLEACSLCLDCVENCPTKSIHARMRAADGAASNGVARTVDVKDAENVD